MSREQAREVLDRYDAAKRICDEAVAAGTDTDEIHDTYQRAMAGLVHDLAAALRDQIT